MSRQVVLMKGILLLDRLDMRNGKGLKLAARFLSSLRGHESRMP